MQQSPPSSNQVKDELSRCLQWAHEQAGRAAASDALGRSIRLLAALGLAADEYAVLHGRLRNALKYSLRNERGPARFELRLLLRAIEGHG